MDVISDTELVRQFRQGDSQAFSMLVKRHQDRLYRLASVHLYQQQDAMDVTQEVFMRAYKGLRGFRFHAEPFTWLYRILINVCAEFNRKSSRDSILQRGADEEIARIKDGANTEVTQHLIEIRELVNRLPKRQHEVVMLRIFEGLSIEETARAMRCRPGTVKALLHKAQKQLRLLEGDML